MIFFKEFLNCSLVSEHFCREQFDIAFFSRKSKNHSINQDSAACYFFDNLGVFAVADGAGGHPSGDQSSAIAIQALTNGIKECPNTIDDIRIAILNSFYKANDSILENLRGSATTLTVTALDLNSGKAHFFHAGDSYGFVLGGLGKPKFKSVGHSAFDFGFESGVIKELNESNEHLRHELVNVIGLPSLRVEVSSPLDLSENDKVFLCSDGLSDNLSVDKISEYAKTMHVEKIRNILIEQVDEEIKRETICSKEDDVTFFIIRKKT